MPEVLPNFFTVGAAKSGTTSLYQYLNQHPEVFVPEIKEPCFFSFAEKQVSFSNEVSFFITKWHDYLNLYKKSVGFKAVGDFSTPYLYFYKETIQNIKKFIPNYQGLKIIIILRNPIDRAFSQYMHNVRDLREKLSFEEAIKLEEKRMAENYHFDFFYIDRGFYYRQVKAYLENFKNVKIFLFEEYKKNVFAVLKGICEFLEIDSSPLNNIDVSKKFNVSGRPKIPFFNRILRSQNYFVKKVKGILPRGFKDNLIDLIFKYNLKKEEMSDEIKEYLKLLYREDVEKLSELIGRDLTGWIK